MKLRTLALWSVAVAASGLLGATFGVQDSGNSKDSAAKQKQDQQMEAWRKYAMPGEEQAWLSKLCGKWNVASKQWAAPGEPPYESKMTSQMDMILGGRFRYEYLVGTRLGMPFEGSGVRGFNNVTKKFELSWVDNFATGISNGIGTRSQDGKSLHWEWTAVDPVSGKPMKMRGVEKSQTEDRYIFEIYAPTADGSEFKALELVYTRAK